MRELERAHALDPLSRMIGTELGWIYYLMRRNDEAEAQTRRTLALDPNYPHGSLILGLVFIAHGRHTEAIRRSGEAIELGATTISVRRTDRRLRPVPATAPPRSGSWVS